MRTSALRFCPHQLLALYILLGMAACGGGSADPTPTPQALPPAITTQPGNVTVTAGSAATFTVSASGTAPISYQWQQSVGSGGTWTNATGSASGPQRAHGACHTCCCHRRKGPRQVLQPQEGQRRDGRKARQRASLGWYQCQRRGLPLAVGSHDPLAESDPVQGGPGPAGRHPPRKGLPGTDPALFPLGQWSSGAYQWLGHACSMPWAQGRGTLQT